MRLKTLNKEIGALGERLASDYLCKKGYKIIAQNYRSKYAEIDLIARHKDILVIVEVRTKTGEQFGSPEDTLRNKKLQKVKQNAAAYAARAKWSKVYRVDAVCIVLNEHHLVQRINHYENV